MKKKTFLLLASCISVGAFGAYATYGTYTASKESSLLTENIEALGQALPYDYATPVDKYNSEDDESFGSYGQILHRCVCYEGYIWKSCDTHGWEGGSASFCPHRIAF